MVQLVFVHGVSVRTDPRQEIGASMRDGLFRKASFADVAQVDIENPQWGDLASSMAWGGASLKVPGAASSFSVDDGGETGGDVRLAELGMRVVVDAIFTEIVSRRRSSGQLLDEETLRLFAAAGAYAEANPRPSWLTAAMTNDEVARGLEAAIHGGDGAASFALGSAIRDAAQALRGRSAHAASRVATTYLREPVARRVASFLGDALVYLKDGPARVAIRSKVAEGLKAAHARVAGGRLVAVGHSFGGVILHDLLSAPGDDLPAGLQIDLLVTVGSQVGLFEELKLFASSDPGVPREGVPKVPPSAGVADWMNVFDVVDPLGYAAGPVFARCADFTFDTATGLFGSHGAYLARPSFHQRLRSRFKETGISP